MAIHNIKDSQPYTPIVQPFTYTGDNSKIVNINFDIPTEEAQRRELDEIYGRRNTTSPQNKSVDERMDGNAWYKYPESEKEDSVVFVSKQIGSPDVMFGNYSQGEDRERFPDHKQYIFTTSRHGKMQVMYPNNIVLPVRDNPDLASMYFGKFQTKTCGVTSDGVYIIDYYAIRNLPTDKAGLYEFLDYYANSGIVLNGAKNTLEDVVNAIHSDRRDAYVRIVSFVPKGVFVSSGAVFLRQTGVVIGYGIAGRYIHPYSEEASYMAGKVAKTATNYIEIDIVDNTGNNDYFVSVGNDIVRLDPEKNLSKPNGASLSIYRNDTCVATRQCNLDSINTELGIYKSKEEAVYNGNVIKAKEQLIENRKLDARILESELSFKKVLHSKELENSKFDNDMLRMAAEKENIELDMEKERLKHQLEEFKHINAAIRTAAETRQLLLKSSIDALKHDHEVKKLGYEQNISIAQFMTKIINLGVSFL